MSATLLQPVLPWSGAQAEDRRFRRILAAVLVVTSVLGAILPQLPVPQLEPEWDGDQPPAVVRVLAKPVTLFAPPSTPAQTTARAETGERQPAPAPEPQAAVIDPPQIPRPVVPSTEPPLPSRPIPERPGPEKEPVGGATEVVATAPPRQIDPQAAARAKAAKTGVLALSDSLRALREFNPSTPGVAGGSGVAVTGRPVTPEKPSLLSAGVARGSGGIGGGIPGPRELLGAPGLQGLGTGPGGGLAAFRGASSGGSGPIPAVRRKTRSEEEIQEILDRHKSAIYTLYNRELRKDPSLQGKVVVSITIAPSGRVTACSIEYSELESDALKEQLIRLIKGVDFGAKADVPAVTTKVPIEFFPV